MSAVEAQGLVQRVCTLIHFLGSGQKKCFLPLFIFQEIFSKYVSIIMTILKQNVVLFLNPPIKTKKSDKNQMKQGNTIQSC